MITDDPYKLQRFVDAQQGVYERVCAELRSGLKTSHWMWFIFPQIRGLGRTETSVFFAISSLAEADAYLNHPVLGPRLRECCGLLLQIQGRSASQILGSPDDLKLRSSMTLFNLATKEEPLFQQVLDRYFQGKPDPATMPKDAVHRPSS